MLPHTEAAMLEEDGGRSLSGDSDSSLVEEIESIRKYCQSIGINIRSSSSDAAASTSLGSISASAAATDYDSELDDLELVRNIEKSFPVAPLSLKPLNSAPPTESEEDEDDFETLRVIQRRFAAYGSGTPKSVLENYVDVNEQVRASSIAPEKETSASLFLNESNSCKGCPDVEDACKKSWNSEDKILENRFSGYIDWHESGAVEPCKPSTFPKVAQLFVDAIRRNRSCQKFLRNKLIHVEAMLEENKKLKERVKILKDFQNSCKRKTSRALSQKRDPRVQLISLPKKRTLQIQKANTKKPSPMNHGPQENFLVQKYKLALSKYPIFLCRERWSKEERENLVKGIQQQFQQMSFDLSVDLWSGSDGFSGDMVDIDELMESIVNFEITPEHIQLFLPKVDWGQLASMYVASRSAAESEARWLNWESPLINHSGWSSSEDRKLLHIVQNKGFSDWFNTASLLDTGRTAFQCLARFQRSLNAFIMKSEWTEEDDVQLRKAVEMYGEHDWQLVASGLDGRTGSQCSNRWMKTLHPTRKKEGKWSEDEDTCLRVSVTLLGPKWNKVAMFVPGRTQVQCRERWVNCLSPSLRWDAWTKVEDAKLESAIREHGYCWSRIANCIPPRTDSQCRRRWMFLFPEEVPLLRAEKNIKKVALISNFVDRESERPALGANDFLPTKARAPVNCTKNESRRKKQNLAENCISSRDAPKSGESRKPRRGRNINKGTPSLPDPGISTITDVEGIQNMEVSRSDIMATDDRDAQNPNRIQPVDFTRAKKPPSKRRPRAKKSLDKINAEEVRENEASRNNNHATGTSNTQISDRIQSGDLVTAKKLPPKRRRRVKKSLDKINEEICVVEVSGSDNHAANPGGVQSEEPVRIEKLRPERRPRVKKSLDKINEEICVMEVSGSDNHAANPLRIQSEEPVRIEKLPPKRRPRVKKSLNKINEDRCVMEVSGSGNHAANPDRIQSEEPVRIGKLPPWRRPRARKSLDEIVRHDLEASRSNNLATGESNNQNPDPVQSQGHVRAKKEPPRRGRRAKRSFDKIDGEEIYKAGLSRSSSHAADESNPAKPRIRSVVPVRTKRRPRAKKSLDKISEEFHEIEFSRRDNHGMNESNAQNSEMHSLNLRAKNSFYGEEINGMDHGNHVVTADANGSGKAVNDSGQVMENGIRSSTRKRLREYDQVMGMGQSRKRRRLDLGEYSVVQ